MKKMVGMKERNKNNNRMKKVIGQEKKAKRVKVTIRIYSSLGEKNLIMI